MKKLSKLRNFTAMFALVAVAMLALSPKVFSATSITESYAGGGSATTTDAGSFPKNMQPGFEWTDVNTLTLTDYVSNNALSIEGDITIVVNGINSITDPHTGDSALYVNGNLTLTGSGTLTVNGYNITLDPDNQSIGSDAIVCTGAMEINGPTIIATGGNNNESGSGGRGVFADSLKVTSGSLTAKGGSSFASIDPPVNDNGGNGVDGNVTIIGGTSVEITGGNGGENDSSFGIGGNGVNGNVTISTGTTPITITGGSSKSSNNNDIYVGGSGVSGNVTISTIPTAGITITGGEGKANTVATAGTHPGHGGDAIGGILTTPTGIIGGSTNITVTGGNGTTATGNVGKQFASHVSSTPTPTPAPTPAPTPTPTPTNPAISPNTGVYN